MDSFRLPAGKSTTKLDTWRRLGSTMAVACAAAVVLPVATRAQQPDGTSAAVAPSVPQQGGGDGFLFRTPLLGLGMRAGFNFARAGSGVFDLATEQLTLERGDFGAFTIAGDLAIRMIDPVDIVLSAGYSNTSKRSEFRDWEDQDGLPITQRTTFSQTPLSAGVRVYLMPRGRQIGRFAWVPERFAPYVGASFGGVHYQFRQVGSFVDFQDLSIFDDTFESSGWTTALFAGGGVDYSVGTRVVLNADVRYQWANADLEQDFVSFSDGIDLNGLQLSAGVRFRF